MSRLVGRLDSILIQNGAKHLSSLKDHLYNVLIGVVSRACSYISVEYEDVHVMPLPVIGPTCCAILGINTGPTFLLEVPLLSTWRLPVYDSVRLVTYKPLVFIES
jgi:hypothetical protein